MREKLKYLIPLTVFLLVVGVIVYGSVVDTRLRKYKPGLVCYEDLTFFEKIVCKINNHDFESRAEKKAKEEELKKKNEITYQEENKEEESVIKHEETKKEEVKEETKEVEAYREGMYKVGVDIPAGEYKIFSRSNCYVECAKDSTGSIESVTFNENLDHETMYVTLQKGDYFKITNAIMYKAANAPIAKSDEICDGMFKVGVDELAPGEYKVVRTGENSYIEVSKDSRHLPSGIIMNDILTTDSYITLSKGQYVTLKGCKLIK